jgi:glycerophosphoryl diester phosphodiesterase
MQKKGYRPMAETLPGGGPTLSWWLGPVAHRVLHDAGKGRIENTPSAFAAAIAKGYAIECDVQAALGDEPMVFHDDALDRLMEAKGPVSARTPAELATLTYREGGDRMPTLAMLLDQVGGQVPLYIEIKTQFGVPGRFEQRIVEIVSGYRGPLALMSFDHRAMLVVRELGAGIPRGLISYRWDDDWMPQLPPAERSKLRNLNYAAEVEPSFIAYDIDDLPEEAPLNLKRRLGIPLLTWTVRSPEQRARAALYADAIIFEGFEP